MALITNVKVSFLFLAVLLPAVSVATPKIEAFTNDEFPIVNSDGIEFSLANLDEAERLTAELGKDLGTDPAVAKNKVLRQVNSPRGHELLQEIPKAFARTARSMRLGVRRLPAVVFDERLVIYGERDLSRAVAIYQEHLSTTGVQP